MLDLQRGQKISIQTVCRTWTLEVELRHQGPLAVDVSCFGLDSAGRLSDERYFLFYNQRRSPEGAMALSEGASGGTARFQVDLAALPDHIQRLSFTAAIDGGRTLRELEQGSIGLWVRGEEMALPPHVCTRMEGLARRCQGDLDFLAPLYKASFAALAQVPRAAERDLQTVLCADASGSMFDLYRGGRVQQMFDKFFALSSTLSDSGALDCWAFAAKSRQLEPVTLDNIRDYTFSQAGGYERWMSMLNYQYNNEPEAMRDVMMIYGALRKPVVVLFLTDGRIHSDWEIEEILIKTSRFPVFWQFIGLHGEAYGLLERLHEIDGRHTANAGFIKMDDIDDITDHALYGELLANVDGWLQEINAKKMLEH